MIETNMTSYLTNPPRTCLEVEARVTKSARDSGRWRERYRLSPSLQAEFGDVETFVAFMKFEGHETEPKPEVRTAPIASPGVFRAEATAAQMTPSVASVHTAPREEASRRPEATQPRPVPQPHTGYTEAELKAFGRERAARFDAAMAKRAQAESSPHMGGRS